MRVPRPIAIVALLAIAALPPVSAEAKPKPGLVVLIVIDQLASTTLTRWGHLLNGGIARLRKEGAYYPNGVHAQANTGTAPGHASIATGAWPRTHGIVSNNWRDEQTGADIYCVGDPAFGIGPKNLEAPTIGDAIRLATAGRGKVVAVSTKDRAAVLTSGFKPTASVWFDPATGRHVAGTWYGAAAAPEWMTRLDAERNGRTAFGKTWERASKTVDYEKESGPDDASWETALPGLGRTFPHVYGKGLEGPDKAWFDAYRGTPEALEMTIALAKAAVTDEKLGQRGELDYLAVAISNLDFAGHWWGPTSQEVLDLLLRADQQIGELMAHVDAKVGRGQTIWVLTGDHGATQAPEVTMAMGVRAERVDPKPIEADVNAELAKLAPKGRPAATVAFFDPPLVFLTRVDPAADRTALRRAAARVYMQHPGVLEAYALEDLGKLSPEMRPMFERFLFPGRSPDVLLLQRPNDLFSSYPQGSGHGSPYNHDTHVPIIVSGPGVRRAYDPAPYEVIRIAPTIAALASIDPPASAYAAPLPAAQ